MRLLPWCALAALGAASTAARAVERPRAAVVVAGERPESSPKDSREALSAAVRQALEKREEISLLDPAREALLFRARRGKLGRKTSSLEGARKHLAQAAEDLAAFELAGASKAIGRAQEALSAWVGLREAVDLDRQRLQLAIAIAHAKRDANRLGQAIAEYVVRFPNEEPPPGMWPPEVLNRVKGSPPESSVLTVQSEPKGTVYIDGREVGPTPVRLGALPAGRHRVEVVLEDHFPSEAWVETHPAKEAQLQLQLKPELSLRFLRLAPGPVPAELLATVRELSAEDKLALLVVAWRRADGKLSLRRVDLTPAPLGAPPHLETVESDTAAAALEQAVGKLFALPPPAEPPSVAARPGKVPMWAWIGGGAGVAAVGTGVVLRLMAVGMQADMDAREGSLTQAQAYQLRDDTEGRAAQGALLVGVGVAALLGIAGWVAVDLLGGGT